MVVELKLVNNKEIKYKPERKKYRSKLQKYLEANCNLGIYVVFDTDNNKKNKETFDLLIKEYDTIKGLNIMKINCY